MAANAPPSVSVDEGGEIVLNRFYDFLAKFTSSAEGTTDGTDGVQLYRDYLAQIAAMVENEKNTVYVDVQHVFAVSERTLHFASQYSVFTSQNGTYFVFQQPNTTESASRAFPACTQRGVHNNARCRLAPPPWLHSFFNCLSHGFGRRR